MADLTKLPYFVTGAGYVDLEVMNPNTSKGLRFARCAKNSAFRPSRSWPSATAATTRPCSTSRASALPMGNGEEALKQKADLIAPTNEEGGVADMLELAIKGEI